MNPSFANIRGVLRICGPLTMREVASFFPGVDYRRVSCFLTAMRLTVVHKQVYIQSWTMERKPPPMNNAERQRRARARLKPPVAVPNSVWQLGAL